MNEMLDETYIIRKISRPQPKPKKKTGFQKFLTILYWLVFFPIAIIVKIIIASYRYLTRPSPDNDVVNQNRSDELRILDSYKAKLERLASLRDQGVITESEFLRIKGDLLSKMIDNE